MIGRLKSPLAISLVDQLLVSAVSLMLTFWLISRWPPADFGVFAIVTSVSLTGLAAHQALAGSQLTVMITRLTNPELERDALATAWAIALGVAFVAGTSIVLGFYWIGGRHGWAVPVLAGLFVALQVGREHVRTYHFAKFEARQVLVNDLLHASTLFVVLAVSVMAGAEVDLALVIGAQCTASFLAMLPTLLRRSGDFVVRLDVAVRRQMSRLWCEHARWALMGATAAEMQTRGHVLAVGTFFSVADLGIIQAGLTLVRPVGLLGAAWVKVARPAMAKDFAAGRLAAAGRYANLSALCFVGATLIYLLVLWLAWPTLVLHVLPSDYHGLELVVPLWGVSILIGLLRTVYSLEAQCVPLFREAFYASMIAMITIFVGLSIVVVIGTAASTILVVALGEGTAMLALILIIRRHVGRVALPDTATVAGGLHHGAE